MSKQPVVWIVVANGEHARIVVKGTPFALRTLRCLKSRHAGLAVSDLVSEGLGRSVESVGGAHHAIEPKHDLHRLENERFAQEIADLLNDAAAAHQFDDLVLAAPGRMLPALREGLSRQAAASLTGTVNKDLVKIGDHDLAEHFTDFVHLATREQAL